MASFIEAVLKAKVAQICNHVGYNAITLDSANILVDIYRRTFIHLARHCKEAANNNRRVEPTLIDLIQAYDFVGISIPELREHIKNVKLPFEKEIVKGEIKPSNRIQRNLLIDDLLEAKKDINTGEHDEDGENKLTINEKEADEGDIPAVPLLKDVYQDIANQFPSPSTPVKADKLRIKREEKPAIPRLKITPLDPAVAEPPSFLPLLDGSKEDRSIPVTIKTLQPSPPLEKKRGPKGKTKTKVAKTKIKNKTKLKTKIKANLKTKVRGRKPKTKTTTTINDPTTANCTPAPDEVVQPKLELPSPSESPAASIHPPSKPPTPPLEPSPKIRTPAPLEEPSIRTPTPSVQSPSISKQSAKGRKKKRKTNNLFAIVTESVTTKSETEEPDWFCPACNGPDNGDLMLQCDGDSCELWFHLKCTGLKKVPEEEEKWYCNNCGIPKAKITPTSKSSKGSKKRSKAHAETESKIPTPQPPTPIQHTPTPPPPPPPPPVKHSPVVVSNQQSTLNSPPMRQSALCGSSDDLCPECQLPDDGTLMIQCEDPDCAKWFHGKCVNVLSAPGKNDIWFCKLCVEKQQSAFKRRRRVK